VKLSGAFDQDLTGVDEREREAHLARVSGKARRRCGQMSNSGDAPVSSGRRRCHDDDQGDTAGSKTWSALSIASSSDSEVRLEAVRASVVFGQLRRA
jgi:hypothetical protein